eukprot:scaffold3377_cov105-Isochrysis_galbana.AAC.8
MAPNAARAAVLWCMCERCGQNARSLAGGAPRCGHDKMCSRTSTRSTGQSAGTAYPTERHKIP